jgi:translin
VAGPGHPDGPPGDLADAGDGARRVDIARLIEGVTAGLDAAHAAREQSLPACRRVIRASGSSIRAVHRLEPARAAALADEAEAELRRAQHVLAPYPALVHAGFLHDAEKEYAEARLTAGLVGGGPLDGPDQLGVDPVSWMKGLAEAASELRRHLLDRLRAGELARAEELLAVMDDVYDALVGVDYPDALTGGLRRTLDALRAVLERSRGDVTTTVLQGRLQQAIDRTVRIDS